MRRRRLHHCPFDGSESTPGADRRIGRSGSDGPAVYAGSMRPSLVLAICLALALAAACKANQDTPEDPRKLGTFTCKDVQNDVCIGQTNRFDATAPVIHFTHTTKDLPKNGDVYTVQWIAEDVGRSAPANTVIDTFREEVTDVVAGTATYTVNNRMTRPTNSWPKGSYRIDVKLGDKLVTTARFTIE